MPCNIAHAPSPTNGKTLSTKSLSTSSKSACSTTIGKGSDLTFPSQIPYDSVACTTGGCKGILDVMVPGEGGDFIKFRTSCSGRIWFTGVFQVPDIDL